MNVITLYLLLQLAILMTPLGSSLVTDFAFLKTPWRFRYRCATDFSPLFSQPAEGSAAPLICTLWCGPAIIPTRNCPKPVTSLNTAVCTAPLTTSISQRPRRAPPALPRPAVRNSGAIDSEVVATNQFGSIKSRGVAELGPTLQP